MKTEIEIDVTPAQLAEMFIHWGNDDQAKFINLVGEHFKKADFDAEMQCCYIAEFITKPGKDFLFTLANFVKVRNKNLNKTDKHLLQNRINAIEKQIKEHDDLLQAGYKTDEAAQIELDLIVVVNRAVEEAQAECDELI
jgi:hypothetical protein